ncbi:ATP-binding cassette domain-containing protein [Solidesulfovibrio sp.]|uniref:ABC transporter ATP-binding protein n=1 Tax=Solidesulfovibrio sp. TaxID=2910990 RepID=UPI00261D7D99|nr:ATP-binding cassette domain-containing protein [Solidesulfovibrio sp.]
MDTGCAMEALAPKPFSPPSGDAPPAIDIRHVFRRNPGRRGKADAVFEDFSLRVGQGEVVGLFGPNGSGKTTLLNMVAGLLRPDAGEIVHAAPQRRVAYVFQDYKNSLFPWFSVETNILFPLAAAGMPVKMRRERLTRLRRTVDIPFGLDKYPYQLSGGQQQYVSVLRGLIGDPSVLLLDEPFSALDQASTAWLREVLRRAFAACRVSALMVSHDLAHFSDLAARVCVLSGRPARVAREILAPRRGRKRREDCPYAGIAQ